MESRINKVCELLRMPIQKREISWSKLTPEILGFDVWDLARRTKAAVLSGAEPNHKNVHGEAIYSIRCPFREMKKKHADFLASVIAMSPYAYGGIQFIADKGAPYLDKQFGIELILPDEHGETIDEGVLAVWYAGVPDLAKEISADPNWFQDKQNRIFISACVYLIMRSFQALESTVVHDKFFANVSQVSAIRDLPEHFPNLQEHLSDQKKCAELLTFCFCTYPSLYATVSQLEETKRELGLKETENAKLSSKASNLEKALEEAKAILKMKTQDSDEKIKFLEEKVNAQSKEIASTNRQKKDEIDALQSKLDQTITEAEMLMKFIQQSDELESVDVKTESEQEGQNDIDLDNMKVLVVGGHENFLNKLRQRFPQWVIPGDELFTSEPTKVDVVIYIHLHCGHSLYAKGRNIAMNTNAYELYTHSVNIEAFIKEVTHNLWKLLVRGSSD